MKNLFLILLYLTLYNLTLAQKTEVELKDLIVPSAPAFTILDFSPKTIERPGTIKALALNVVNEVGRSTGFPKNFATEFAPYWLFENFNMDIFKYHGIKHSDSGYTGQNIFSGLRATSVSLGSLFRDSSKKLPVDVNYISYGVRSNVLAIRRPTVLKYVYQRIIDINEVITKILEDIDCSQFKEGSLDYLKCLASKAEKQLQTDAALNTLRKEFTDLLNVRPSFAVDLAFAASTAFGDNSISNNKQYRTGAWATLAFSLPLIKAGDVEKLLKNKNYINAYVLLRLIDENQTTDFKTFQNNDYFDIGGRAEVEFNRFSFSIESIHRSNKSNRNLNTSKTVGIIQYRLTDHFYLSGTFGKDFGNVQNLISVLGVNWGFGGNAIFQKLQ